MELPQENVKIKSSVKIDDTVQHDWDFNNQKGPTGINDYKGLTGSPKYTVRESLTGIKGIEINNDPNKNEAEYYAKASISIEAYRNEPNSEKYMIDMLKKQIADQIIKNTSFSIEIRQVDHNVEFKVSADCHKIEDIHRGDITSDFLYMSL